MESAEIERELEELESRVERLRALYEQYFMGIEKMEPQIPRKDVERRIWILRREQIRNTGLRFKFQMIVQRYNTFQQYWARVAREIENGTYRRDVMRAALRFGEKDALTVLGKKRADQYKTLLENQRKLRESGRKATAAVVGDDAAESVDEPAQRGAEWGDITEVMGPHEDAPDDREESTPPSMTEAVGPAKPPPLPVAASAQKSLAGLRWSPSGRPPPPAAPSEPTVARDVPPPATSSENTTTAPAPTNPRRRVAELAAEMRARKADQEVERARPDTLDLDFDADMTMPQPMLPSPLLPNGGGPPAGAPKRRRSSKSMRAVRVEPTPPPIPAPAAPPPPMIHEADAAWNDQTQPSMRRKLAAAAAEAARAVPPPAPPAGATPGSPTVPSGPARPAAPPRPPPRPAPAPRPSEPTKAEPAAGRTPQDLSEQRIRQIYSKYVETKRAANESTAGVTYERLAESLRAQANKLRTSHPTKSVDYEVVTKDGKTMLKPILR